MADVLAMALAAPAPAGAAAAQRGGGGQRSAGTRVGDRLARIERLLIAHERQIHTLEDRVQWVVLLKRTSVAQPVLELRDRWRQLQPDRSAPGLATGPPPKHPLGSQRALVHAAVFKEFVARIPGDSPARKSAEYLAGLSGQQVDAMVFRLRPKHPGPKEGRVWVWYLLPEEGVAEDYRRALQAVSEFRHEDIGLARARSGDGPLARAMAQLRLDGADDGEGEMADGTTPRGGGGGRAEKRRRGR